MSTTELPASHAELMDGVYRWQRHIYDLTRKYYLLGRDRLIDGLEVPAGGTVLELGCGTGRNIILAARRYPDARFFGLDISAEMLETASTAIAREGLSIVSRSPKATPRHSMPRHCSARGFDRVFVSYSLSMIPGWEKTVSAALAPSPPTVRCMSSTSASRRACRAGSGPCCAAGSGNSTSHRAQPCARFWNRNLGEPAQASVLSRLCLARRGRATQPHLSSSMGEVAP